MSADKAEASTEARLTPKQAAWLLLALVVALAAYVAIGALLGLIALFAGSLLLFFWAGVEHLNLNALPSVLFGSLGGLVNGALFAILAPALGEGLAALAGLMVLLAAIYCLLLKWMPLIFNQAYMLMLTVTLAPPILTQGKFIEMAFAVFYSAAFWGGIVVAIGWVRNRRASQASLTRAS